MVKPGLESARRELLILPRLGRGDLKVEPAGFCYVPLYLSPFMDTGYKRREIAGNFSSSWFIAIKRELCNAMHFAISLMLLIIRK